MAAWHGDFAVMNNSKPFRMGNGLGSYLLLTSSYHVLKIICCKPVACVHDGGRAGGMVR